MIRLDRQPTAVELRWFGAALASLLSVIGVAAWIRSGFGPAAGTCLAGAAALLAVYYGLPSTQRSIHRAWTLATFPVAWTVSTLTLAVLFFGIITPIGLASRLCGRDPLRRSPRSEESYWRKRRTESPPAASYFRQY